MVFPSFTQLDAMDCGPTCLRMIAKFYGKNYSLQTLRTKCHITREGVSMLGISDAAELIGFRTEGVKLTWEQLRDNIPFPFIPIQITVLDAAIEGYPSFLTIWESDTRKIRGRFLKTALSNALPFALTVTAMVVVTSIIAPFTVEQRQTVMYFLLIVISMAAVVKSCIPFNGLRTFICITMVIGTFGGLAILPSLFEISAITAGMGKYLLAGGSLSVVCLLLLLGTRGVLGRKRLSEAEAVR